MSPAQFRAVKLGIVITLSIIVSTSVVRGNAVVPIIAAAAAFAGLLLVKTRVRGVIADERDYEVAGRASLLTIQIYALVAAMPMIALYALRDQNPFYEPVASTLAYSLCFLLLIQACAFRYYDRIQRLGKKTLYAVLLGIVVALMTIAGLRLFSGEDGWACTGGAWVAHGHPSFPAPTTPCQSSS